MGGPPTNTSSAPSEATSLRLLGTQPGLREPNASTMTLAKVRAAGGSPDSLEASVRAAQDICDPAVFSGRGRL